MPNVTGFDRAGERTRESPDLCQQYRPIGIGAVAAALTMNRKADTGQPQEAANSNGRIGAGGSRAA
jgi:hypothetical protein